MQKPPAATPDHCQHAKFGRVALARAIEAASRLVRTKSWGWQGASKAGIWPVLAYPVKPQEMAGTRNQTTGIGSTTRFVIWQSRIAWR